LVKVKRLVKVKVKDNHDFLHKIRVAKQKHVLLVEHGRQGLTSSLQRTKGKIMEPRTKEQASKDEEFDFWTFQAHECGVGETIKRNYCISKSLEREGIFVQEAVVEPEKSQI
jgi:hypothetical protein